MRKQGHADVLIGLQNGDEGKAAEIDKRAGDYDIIARFNGGANAGHTIVKEGVGKIALNQVPSGILHAETKLYIGSGCVVNVIKLAREIRNLIKFSVDLTERLFISPQASLVQPMHLELDKKWGRTIGTTNNGIGPCYADRAYRMKGEQLVSIRMGELADDPETYLKVLERYAAEEKPMSMEERDELQQALEYIRPFVVEDPLFLTKEANKGAKILFEGAQSFMLDVGKGTVPYVTSSNTAAAAAYVGGDLPPSFHRKTIGVAKAIMSRVGFGPFPSEFGGKTSEDYCMSLNNDGTPKYSRSVEEELDLETQLTSKDDFEMSKAIRRLSGEYGTVTSRPRRVGALDLVQLRYAIEANRVEEIMLTKCDLLNVFTRTETGKIPLVTAYELDGKQIDYFPSATNVVSRVKPVTEWHDGFSEDISSVRNQNDLPENLLKLLRVIERQTGTKITRIGVGPEREQFVDTDLSA